MASIDLRNQIPTYNLDSQSAGLPAQWPAPLLSTPLIPAIAPTMARDDDEDEDEDEDWDLEEDLPMEEEFGVVENSSIGASIIAAKLSIGNNCRVTVEGSSIQGIRPLLGLVE